MKRIEDYTDEELINLTEEQVTDLIDLECGYEGVRLLPTLPDPPDQVDAKEDLEVFEVPAMTLSNHEDASRLIAFATTLEHVKTQYVSGPSYKRYGEPIPGAQMAGELVVSSRHVYSREHYKKIDSILAQYEASKQTYDKAKTEYDDIQKERETVMQGVNEAVNKARKNIHKLHQLETASLRFLTLAHGDKEIAKRFMLDAYKANADAIEEHFEAWTIQHVTDKMAE